MLVILIWDLRSCSWDNLSLESEGREFVMTSLEEGFVDFMVNFRVVGVWYLS